MSSDLRAEVLGAIGPGERVSSIELGARLRRHPTELRYVLANLEAEGELCSEASPSGNRAWWRLTIDDLDG